ncbi:MAG: hypothetical protein KJO33_11545 [Gammaproteobacteria bacterium]|nr:hypothetical protein [Gammaproteobacteria bacterium]
MYLSADPALDLGPRYIALAIQGDLVPAARLFADLDPDTSTPADRALADHFRDRFIARTEPTRPDSGEPLVDDVVAAYRNYWIDVMTGSKPEREAAVDLESTLESANPGNDPHSRTGSAIFDQLDLQLEALGLHVLEEHAPPYRDLLIWRSEKMVNYRVQLTDRAHHVPVVFMDDFISMGWKHYASLGLASTTGWVEDGKLYCVGWAYDRTSENFRVSYLKHEARHLADLERYPELDSTELEYRAKLTELAFAFNSLVRLLRDFTVKSAQNPDSPHALANFRVTRDIYAELHERPFPEDGDPWEYVSTERVNRAARSLLDRHTRALGAGAGG